MLTPVVTSASIERLFSTYGLVHTKLRNKLGNEKAGKLVFLYKALNSVLKMFLKNNNNKSDKYCVIYHLKHLSVFHF